MPNTLKLPSLNQPRVLVIGEVVLDCYLWGRISRISPEAPIPVLEMTRREERPGNAAFVCANLAQLGAAPALASVTGADRNGIVLSQAMNELGVATRALVRDSGRPTIVKERMLGFVQSAQRATQQLLRVDNEDTRPLTPAVETELLARLEAELETMDGAVVCDLNKGLLSATLLQAIIQGGRRCGRPVIIDPRLTDDYSIYRGATALTPNRYETERATGINLASPENWPAAAQRLIESCDLQMCLITLDRDGMFLALRDGSTRHISTIPLEVYDVTGAGDIVLAVFGWLMAGGSDPFTAAAIANVAAGVEVTKQGCAIVPRAEIEAALSQGHDHSMRKILDLRTLSEQLHQRRRAGQRICFTNGCFDLLHAGHVELMEFARAHGDLLVVGINSDRAVRELKGADRPVYPEMDRARIVAAMAAVDYVTIFDDTRAEAIIRAVAPDVLIKGDDYLGRTVDGADFVRSHGGRVVLAPLLDGRATSATVARLRAGES